MTVHLLDHHPGHHGAPPSPSIFRRLMRSIRREPSGPEVHPTSGPATGPMYQRPTYYGRHDGAVIVDEQERIVVRPVNGRTLGTRPRRQPAETRADLTALARPYAPQATG